MTSRTERGARSAFTLIELIVAIVIAATTIAAVTVIFVQGMKNIRQIDRLEALHENAILVSGQLSHLIKTSAAVSIPSSSTLDLSFLDGTSSTISLAGGAITLDGSPLTPDGISVQTLTFTRMADSVKTNFTLGFADGPEAYAATSVVAVRNSF